MENRFGEIRARLEAMADPVYRAFQIRLMPSVAPEAVLGVRTPELRKNVVEIADTDTARKFLKAIPHACYDENNLHALLILTPALPRWRRFCPI